MQVYRQQRYKFRRKKALPGAASFKERSPCRESGGISEGDRGEAVGGRRSVPVRWLSLFRCDDRGCSGVVWRLFRCGGRVCFGVVVGGIGGTGGAVGQVDSGGKVRLRGSGAARFEARSGRRAGLVRCGGRGSRQARGAGRTDGFRCGGGGVAAYSEAGPGAACRPIPAGRFRRDGQVAVVGWRCVCEACLGPSPFRATSCSGRTRSSVSSRRSSARSQRDSPAG